MTYHAARSLGKPGAPLVLTFHGTGGDEHQFHATALDLMRGAHVVSPRGDVSEAGALRFFRRSDEGVYDMDDLAERTEAMVRFIGAERRRTGASRVIALGYSNGANILASVMFAAPDLVTDAALMHPLIPWQPAPQPGLAAARVLITAGERDPICPPDRTRALVRWFETQGARVTTAWHRGGHELRPEEMRAVEAFVGPRVA